MDYRLVTNNQIRFVAIGISLLLTLWAVYIDPVVNNDGILYILLADAINAGNYHNVFDIFRWPFYSFILAGISSTTGISNELGAYLLSAVFVVVIILSFINIVITLGAEKKVILIACIVILLFPGINRYRSFISRDFGFLAFYMLSMLIFFKHIIKPEWYFPLLWSLTLILASLFRIEAAVLLICLPFIYWYLSSAPDYKRIKIVFSFLFALIFIIFLFAWWFSGTQLATGEYYGIGSGFDLVGKFYNYMVSAYTGRLEQLRILLTQYSKNYAPVILVVTLVIILFSEVIKGITVPYFVLLVYGWQKYKVFSDTRVRNAWFSLIVVHLFILAGALLKYFFITGRFPLALSLTVLLAVPFMLEGATRQWQQERNKSPATNWALPVFIVLVVIISLQGLNTFTAKTHFKEAGLWIGQHIQPGERLLSSDIPIAYYAGQNPYQRDVSRPWDAMQPYEREDVLKILRETAGSDYDYIAVSIRKKDSMQEKEISRLVGITPNKKLTNRIGDQVLIFRRGKAGS